MSTDTAFALGMLALVGPRFPDRLRAFMLTVAVVDDIGRARRDRDRLHRPTSTSLALGLAIAVLAVVWLAARVGAPLRRSSTCLLGAPAWVAMIRSGIDPVVVGLAMGLLTYASPAARIDLERATDLFRLFREQPTPELARSASIGLQAAISPERAAPAALPPAGRAT